MASEKNSYAFRQFKQGVVGLLADFWKDGNESPFVFSFSRRAPESEPKNYLAIKSVQPNPPSSIPTSLSNNPLLWCAKPGEISEKMWGDGFVAPGATRVTELLMSPLGLNKDMSVLDLSAGLGERMILSAKKFGAYIEGLEPDPQIAARGMLHLKKTGNAKKNSIAAYDPNNLILSRNYDCMIARETFYRVTAKDAIFRTIADHLKSRGQISYTDYIVNTEDNSNPHIKAWRQFEIGCAPLSVAEIKKVSASVGVTIRVHDDQTAFYKAEIYAGLKHFSEFCRSGVNPDGTTIQSMRKRMIRGNVVWHRWSRA